MLTQSKDDKTKSSEQGPVRAVQAYFPSPQAAALRSEISALSGAKKARFDKRAAKYYSELKKANYECLKRRGRFCRLTGSEE